jgi:hypothetical protein
MSSHAFGTLGGGDGGEEEEAEAEEAEEAEEEAEEEEETDAAREDGDDNEGEVEDEGRRRRRRRPGRWRTPSMSPHHVDALQRHLHARLDRGVRALHGARRVPHRGAGGESKKREHFKMTTVARIL